MIEVLDDFPDNVVGFRGTGHITRQDYETVVIPAVEAAFKQYKTIRLYYQFDPDFAGLDPGAMWEDFKVGMEHFTHWERIAIVTDMDWISNALKVFAFLMPGDIRHFTLADADQARAWIVSPVAPTSQPSAQDSVDNH
ncbi:MAG TPA: STAS/SEC14 domain-containing protein [Ktedonobacterales bacterium]